MLELFRICPHTDEEQAIIEVETFNCSRIFTFASFSLSCRLIYESENRKGYWFAMALPNGTRHQMFFPKSEWSTRK